MFFVLFIFVTIVEVIGCEQASETTYLNCFGWGTLLGYAFSYGTSSLSRCYFDLPHNAHCKISVTFFWQEMVGKYKANFYTLQGLTLESRKRWDSDDWYFGVMDWNCLVISFCCLSYTRQVLLRVEPYHDGLLCPLLPLLYKEFISSEMCIVNTSMELSRVVQELYNSLSVNSRLHVLSTFS